MNFLEHCVETVTISGYEFRVKIKKKTVGEILSCVTEKAMRHFVAGYCSNLNIV